MPGNENALVRPAQVSDAPQIARVHVESWRVAYRGQISDAILDAQSVERRTTFWRDRLVQPQGTVLVSEIAQSICGFCDLIPSRDNDAEAGLVAEIAALYVLSGHWRKGLGRALCERALAEARRQDYEVVTLWVLASNDHARRFYEAMGFCLDGTTKTERLADGMNLHEIRFRLAIWPRARW